MGHFPGPGQSCNILFSLFAGKRLISNLLRIAIQDNLTPAHGGFFIHDIAGMCGWDLLVSLWKALIPAGKHSWVLIEAIMLHWQSRRGYCSNSKAYGDNACGSLHMELSLQPGESRELLVLMGIGDARYDWEENPGRVWNHRTCMRMNFGRIKSHWHRKIGEPDCRNTGCGVQPHD